jgi:hypothetical protein
VWAVIVANWRLHKNLRTVISKACQWQVVLKEDIQRMAMVPYSNAMQTDVAKCHAPYLRKGRATSPRR